MRLTLSIIFLSHIYLNIRTANADDLTPLITKFCLEQFNAEMKNANLKPSTEMSEFTCECFLSKINKGLSIATATKVCKAKTFEKFSPIISSPQNITEDNVIN